MTWTYTMDLLKRLYCISSDVIFNSMSYRLTSASFLGRRVRVLIHRLTWPTSVEWKLKEDTLLRNQMKI